ncbi:uncharacterized protein B0T15DRAFT_516157 [Chaetomium strumarium]|uniref:F-box domain-containing protein n=1 Tax=Chaetomium strumarium TaxID=1170767 RepID=A0AAJ0H191_9PEZI|nr:hypothetical protein B0T15DRAFT_516157 [Chaetomium strumarium]
MAGLSNLPLEILLHIFSFLDAQEITTLQRVSRRFHSVTRDNGLWRVRCFEESPFLEALNNRRLILGPYHQLSQQSFETSSGVSDTSEDNQGEGGTPSTRGPRRRHVTALATSPFSNKESKEPERVRIMANWDPSFPSERVSWYDEYIQRHGPIAVNWMQNAYNGQRASPENIVEARGVALYYPDGVLGQTILAVSPLDDGSVCLWDVGGTKGKRGAIIARSRPGILLVDGPGADNKRRSKRVDSGVTECVSVDSRQHKAFFAVQHHLIEVDLRRLSVVDCESFPWSITALSAASPTVPLTVGTNPGIFLHDYRTRKPPCNDQGEVLDGFELMSTKRLYERSLRLIFDPAPPPDYAALSQPAPLSILHLERPGQEADLSDDIYVAGRFSNILHYDRRKFPRIQDSIHSGASLCGMTSLPYPFSKEASDLRRYGGLLSEEVEASKSVASGRTLIACGEYNTKGSLELYGLTSDTSTSTSTTGSLRTSNLKNRQTCASSKLLSVVNHGTRIAFSDASGYIKWVERDGVTEVRRCKIGQSEKSESYSIFASMPGSDEIARKLLPTQPAAEAGSDDGNGTRNDNNLLFWTGDKLGLVTFSSRPGFTAEDFEEETETPDAQLFLAQSEYSKRMRRALELQADDVRFVRNLGLGSGLQPASV